MVVLVNVEILHFLLQSNRHWEGLLLYFFLIYSFARISVGINTEINKLLPPYFLMELCVSWNCTECQGTSEIVFMKWILKKGVGFPELKTAVFVIPALSWCSAGRASCSSWADSWHQEELVWIPSRGASLLLLKSCSPALFVCALKTAKVWKNSAFKAVISVRCGGFCGQWPPAAYLPSKI